MSNVLQMVYRELPLSRLTPDEYFGRYVELFRSCAALEVSSIGAIRNHPDLIRRFRRLELEFMILSAPEQTMALSIMERHSQSAGESVGLFENFAALHRDSFAGHSDYIGKKLLELEPVGLAI